MATRKSDAELVEEFRKGRVECYEELVRKYNARAYSLVTRLTRNQEDAEEVLQDVFVTVYRKITGFEGKSSFSSWLYRVTVNAALMKLRKRRTDKTVHLEDLLPEIESSTSMRGHGDCEGDRSTARSQLCTVLEEAIDKLPDEYRPVFVLRDVDGLTSREVSKILNLTVPAVKSRLHRSRLMLRRKLLRFYREYTGCEPKDINASHSTS